MADITLTEAWTQPIARGSYFTGEYNGNGYTISGLNMNTSGDAALFHTVNGATLTGIHLRDVEITGNYAAALAVFAQNNTTISLCSATGNVTGIYSTGGLVGILDGSTLLRSRATCNVTGHSNAGGLVGYNDSSTILGCMAGGSVTNTATNKGGLVGYNYGAIYHSYTTTPNINLVGNNNNGTIESCYDTNAVAPGPLVRSGEHEAAGKTYKGTDIWTSGDYPTLRYTYEGISKQ